MSRSTLVSLVVALACSCRPTLQSQLRSDADSMRSLAAEADALRAQQAVCHAKRSQVFTEAEVQAIGEHALSKWLAGRKTAPEARLSRVAAAMRSHVPARSWQFLVVEDAKVDSFSVPPSTVLVTSGLLTALKPDGALAGVVAHELAHLTANDALDLVRQQNELQCLMRQVTASAVSASNVQLGMNPVFDPKDPALTSMGDRLVQTLMTNGYGEKNQATPQDELSADAQAARWLHASGFDVREYTNALATLGGLSVPHPPSAKRVEALETLRQTLPPLPAVKPKK